MPEEKTGDDCYKGMMNDDKDEIEVEAENEVEA